MGGLRAQHADHLRHHADRHAGHRGRAAARPASSARTRSSGAPSPDRTPHPMLGVIGYVAAGLTAFYMGRLLFLTFFGACAGRSSHPGSPARVAGGDDAAADRARGAGGRGRVSSDPAHRRAGDRRRARRARAARDATALAITLAVGGLALAWFFYVARPDLPGPRRERARRLLCAWCATSTASTSCTTASSTVRSWPWPTPRRG